MDVDGATGGDRPSGPTLETLGLMAGASLVRWLAGGLGTSLFVLAPPLGTRPWTLVTSVYAHGSVGHLLSNALALALVGLVLERHTTRARFHAFFVTVGALAGVVQVVLGSLVSLAAVGVLGASGAVFGCLGYLLASNRLAGGLLGLAPLSTRATAGAVVVLAALLAVVWSPPGSALLAHFAGLLFGLAAGRLHLLAPE